ncbi:MAG: hypothetical protein BroJett021_21190 [Chloroflexota bacterium]|nr:ion transporter [Caldilinea sp.]GIK73131.1 MAG: hypothetical protein BroJett021_21190 [Chloroflexota bacterium]
MTKSSTTIRQAEVNRYLLHANYELFVLGIVVIALVNDLLEMLAIDSEITAVANSMNAILVSFLLFDAVMRLFWRGFGVRWLVHGGGWLVFLGSIPLPFFGVARLLRAVLSIRKLRRIDILNAGVTIRAKRAQSTLLGVLLFAIIGLELAGITILLVEDANPEANIQNASDALWWSYVTIATVGYGDRYPVTIGGRITGAVVITLGVALFSTLTGFLSEWFRRPRMVAPSTQPTVNDSDDLYAMLIAMRQAIEDKANADQTALAELRTRLEQIERRLNNQ